MGTTGRLAEFIVGTEFRDIPEKAVKAAKTSVMDTIGVALVNSVRPMGRIITDFLNDNGGRPVARVIGTGVRTSAPDAAFANAALGRGADFDEEGYSGALHLPAALALGEQLGASGRRILEAYVVSHEVVTRIVSNIGADAARGWDAQGITSSMGAAAAAAKMLGLSTQQTQTALGISASQASGLKQNFGTMTKPFTSGHGVRSGVVAALLAKNGFTADKSILEGKFGYTACFGGEQCNIARMTENLGNPFRIEAAGVGFTAAPRPKRFPCCVMTHPPVLSVLSLKERHGIQPTELESIEVVTNRGLPGSLIRANPKTGEEARFSMEFCLAVALLDGKLDLDSFTDEKANNVEIQRLMRKVRFYRHPDWQGKPSRTVEDDIFWDVVVKLRTGRQYSERVDGWPPGLAGGEVVSKYRDNAGRVLAPPQVEQSIELLERLEDVRDIGELMDLVTSGAGPS